eukprot:c16583_g1_i1.p1 GENE.c16583_g1_i1~~c16583_g1_i1.p1  ORF type:complete len:230 (-),score=43.89 c16583_g1_i1:93-782(-)
MAVLIVGESKFILLLTFVILILQFNILDACKLDLMMSEDQDVNRLNPEFQSCWEAVNTTSNWTCNKVIAGTEELIWGLCLCNCHHFCHFGWIHDPICEDFIHNNASSSETILWISLVCSFGGILLVGCCYVGGKKVKVIANRVLATYIADFYQIHSPNILVDTFDQITRRPEFNNTTDSEDHVGRDFTTALMSAHEVAFVFTDLENSTPISNADFGAYKCIQEIHDSIM